MDNNREKVSSQQSRGKPWGILRDKQRTASSKVVTPPPQAVGVFSVAKTKLLMAVVMATFAELIIIVLTTIYSKNVYVLFVGSLISTVIVIVLGILIYYYIRNRTRLAAASSEAKRKATMHSVRLFAVFIIAGSILYLILSILSRNTTSSTNYTTDYSYAFILLLVGIIGFVYLIYEYIGANPTAFVYAAVLCILLVVACLALIAVVKNNPFPTNIMVIDIIALICFSYKYIKTRKSVSKVR